ncbi:MAG TPA: c-type cytochrome [Gemmatimonadales bacterium]|nr:c-type cytochrome [Gemmatimonadales bacterium]
MRNAAILVVLLCAITARSARTQGSAAPSLERLSPFSATKARTLLRHRLPCLGCHRLDGEGGTVGPDLTGVGARRSGAFIYAMITDPARTWPGTRMPKIPMPPEWARLVAAYLSVAPSGGVVPAVETSETASRSPALAEIEDPAALYAQACAACHGERGGGDGPNAANLPVRPTAHADSAYMSRRPDDTLFDGIYGGGYVLNKSHRMPAFGLTLSREQIHGLVGYLRRLCRCQGPAWSRQ